MTNELFSFVKDSLEKGKSREEIRAALASASWTDDAIEHALASFAEIPFPVAVPKPKPRLQAREAFLYLLSFITLYISSFSFGVLLFTFINKWFPDALNPSSAPFFDLKTPLAAIVIAFPLYSVLTWKLAKDAVRNLERRQSDIKKLLTYLTLVIAAAVIIGDLIAVVSHLLGGELTVRFVLKVATILLITGSIFGYYLWDVQNGEKEKRERIRSKTPLAVKIFAGAVMACVLVSAGYGFSLVGTPGAQRLLAFDQRRIQDVSSISTGIESYWMKTGKLPLGLDDLVVQHFDYGSIKDPKTNTLYEYRQITTDSYEICAIFETDSKKADRSGSYSSIQPYPYGSEDASWQHGIGRTCFQRRVQLPVQGAMPYTVPVK